MMELNSSTIEVFLLITLAVGVIASILAVRAILIVRREAYRDRTADFDLLKERVQENLNKDKNGK